MSKIGKKELSLSKYMSDIDKTIDIKINTLKRTNKDIRIIKKLVVSGPKGTQFLYIPDYFKLEIKKESLTLKVLPENLNENKNILRKRNQLWGTIWTQLNQLIQGVSIGFKR